MCVCVEPYINPQDWGMHSAYNLNEKAAVVLTIHHFYLNFFLQIFLRGDPYAKNFGKFNFFLKYVEMYLKHQRIDIYIIY